MNYEGSHFASFIPLTIVLLGADRQFLKEIMDILLTRYFYPCLLV